MEESNWLLREEMLIGKEKIEKLKKATVAIFGLGGVGSYVCESLCRAGVGNLVLVDSDTVDITNINRQLIADTTTIGKSKVDIAKERVLKINPTCQVTTYSEYYDKSKNDTLLSKDYTYIADCIDSVTSKLDLADAAHFLSIPLISSMGTGNKLDPTKFEVTDINKTEVCPLAKVMRRELRNKGIKKLKVVYSKEQPISISKGKPGKRTPASISFVPSVAGLILASEIVKDIIVNV